MFQLYKLLMILATPALNMLLAKRLKNGKELAGRINERRGIPSLPCPQGSLIWVHAASVGEAQSALILIDNILQKSPSAHILVTSGTVTSADLMQKRLPPRAQHQFVPIDHPQWVIRFLNHWQPDMAFWMESELWPNMLLALKAQKIPTYLINARLSESSFKKWSIVRGSAKKLLGVFTKILTQSDKDAEHYKSLEAQNVQTVGNLKYSAAPLPYDNNELDTLQNATKGRPLWLYASTHDGEEELAAQTHQLLKQNHPDILTITVPRHPERRDDIAAKLQNKNLQIAFRGDRKTLPDNKTDIYIADTLGELGLFYRLCPVAIIGRSFSNDGGGGHNPIEAAQLDCIVLTGPNVQYQKVLFNDMIAAEAARQVTNGAELFQILDEILSQPEKQAEMTIKAQDFIEKQSHIIDRLMDEIDFS